MPNQQETKGRREEGESVSERTRPERGRDEGDGNEERKKEDVRARRTTFLGVKTTAA